jgi:hypothetical protein
MDYVDIAGKINEHEDYVTLLNIIEEKCLYLEIVPICDNKENELVKMFKEDLISESQVSTWWGTNMQGETSLYKVAASPQLFLKLKQYETFFKFYYENNVGLIETDFGQDDIAFFDDKEDPLLFMTPHEGYISLRRDIKF